MNNNGHPSSTIDMKQFMENRDRFPDSELQKYAGLRVAFSLDGTRILAAGSDYAEVDAELQRMGLSNNEVVWEYVPGLEEGSWL